MDIKNGTVVRKSHDMPNFFPMSLYLIGRDCQVAKQEILVWVLHGVEWRFEIVGLA